MKKRLPYILISILWFLLFLISNPCGSDLPIFEIWLVTATAVPIIFAWSISIREGLEPKGFKNISLLFGKGLLSLIYALGLTILISLPFAIFMPAYQCYNDRAKNTEIIASVLAAKSEITNIIESSDNQPYDFSAISKFEHERIDYFQITKDGQILVHSTDPDFTIYLIPTIDNGQINWACKAFPVKKAPANCR